MGEEISRIGATALAITRLYDAPSDVVYRAMTEPRQMERWIGLADPDLSLVRYDQDFVVGGSWRSVIRHRGGGEFAVEGRYLEIVPDRRIAFTENFGDFRGKMEVTVEFRSKGMTATEVRTRVNFISQSIRDEVLALGIIEQTEPLYRGLADFVRQATRDGSKA